MVRSCHAIRPPLVVGDEEDEEEYSARRIDGTAPGRKREMRNDGAIFVFFLFSVLS